MSGTRHSFFSRVLGGDSKKENNGPFNNTSNNEETTYSNTYSYMNDNIMKEMLLSEISLNNNQFEPQVIVEEESVGNINFNSEHEDEDTDESDDDSDGEESSNKSNDGVPDLEANRLSKTDKNRIRKQLEEELELGNEYDDQYGYESDVEIGMLQSVYQQVEKVKQNIGPMTQKVQETVNNSILQPHVPTFISNKKQTIEENRRQFMNTKKLPAKERALWMWANIVNLDIFLNDVYDYYINNGWNCIVLSMICDSLIVIFVIFLTSFMGNCIDYNTLFNENVNKLSQVYDGQCYAKISSTQKAFYVLLGVLLLLKIKNSINNLRDLNEIKLFYNYLLNIDDSELQTISWPSIVKKIMILKNQNTNAFINDNDNDLKSKEKLNAHDIANRLMRRDNYMIAMFNKNILNKSLTIPFLSSHFLTKTLEWNLKFCIFDYLFNDQGQIKAKVLSQHQRLTLIMELRKRFRIAGLLSLIVTPFLVIYFILYYFLKLFYDFKTNPGLLNARSYSPLARWKMREYNELPHLFEERLNLSIEYADDYLNQFPKELPNILLKFVSFITGSIVTILVILTIIDSENFLNFELTEGRTVLFYISTLGAVFTICKNSISNNNNKYLFNPETSLKNVSNYTHYLPNSWENRYHTVEVKNQFCDLYNLKLTLIFKELLSLILLPYVLYISLPNSSDKIIDFFRDYTIHVDGIGYVCTFAMFNMEKNKDHVVPNNSNTTNDKMVQSYMHFVKSYGTTGVKGTNTTNGALHSDSHKINNIKFRNPTQNIIQRNIPNNKSNSLLKSTLLNNRKRNINGNGGISKMNNSDDNEEVDDNGIHEQMEETNAGLSHAMNYIDDLSNSMMLGESYQMGYMKPTDNPTTNDIEDETNNKSSGGVLGLLNQVYKHK